MTDTAIRYAGDPTEPNSIPAILRERVELTPDAPFLYFDGTTRTYGEMLAAAERTAAALASLGVGRGTNVAALLPNCTEILDTWFGAALLGAVFVPINVGLRGEGLAYIVGHSEPHVIVVDAPLVQTLEAVLPAGAPPQHRLVRRAAAPVDGDARSDGDPPPGGDPVPSGYVDFAELVAGGHSVPAWPTVRPGELASILYTSGTTGLPKGVMNCHNAYAVPAYEFTRRYVRIRQDDVLYTSLPLFHANAQSTTTAGALVSGRPAVIAPRFSASQFFDDIRAHHATVFNSIGAMITILFKQPERPDDADNPVRLAISSAAPAELWRQFEARFAVKLVEIYGLTETATFCLATPPDDVRPGAIGRPVSWSQVRIVDPDSGGEQPDGEPGEIVIASRRPDTLFVGYYKNEDATDKAVVDGWFHSGDRGRREADGNFIFMDRLKDSIRRRGENISSYEIERIVNSNPLVAESAAVGVPSELGEEDVMVVIVPRAGTFDPAQLVDYCRERMAGFMVPRYVRVVDRLPKTATERVQKVALREAGVAGAWDRDGD